jgi:cytochrome c oxidase assembly protein subunit 11
MRWQFRPHQKEIKLVPGETALAFYTARNPTDKPVTGIATYNVIPFEAGLYFNKIQCFCFEEQRLNPREQVGWISNIVQHQVLSNFFGFTIKFS